jgi:hypothetical protein
MAIGNLGAVKTLIEGFLYSEFNKDTTNTSQSTFAHNQGEGVILEMIERIASRADLTQQSLKVYAPTLYQGAVVTVTSSPCILLAVVAQSTSTEAASRAVVLYDASAGTIGTTAYKAMLDVRAGGTAATATWNAAVYPSPVIYTTALSFTVTDNSADTNIEGTTQGTTNGTRVMVVYAQ